MSSSELLVDTFFADDLSEFAESGSSPSSNDDNQVPDGTNKKRRWAVRNASGNVLNSTDIKLLNSEGLPECKYVMTTKASVLECAVSTIKRLQTVASTLTSENKSLQRQNRLLLQEMDRLREQGIFIQMIPTEEEEEVLSFGLNGGVSDDQFLSSILGKELQGTTNIMSNVDLPSLKLPSLPLSVVDSDPFLSDYCSSTTGSPLGSPHSSGSSPYSSDASIYSPFDYRSLQEDSSSDPEPSPFVRYTKRRLLFVFLFMLPLFISLDYILPSNSEDGTDTYTTRVLSGISEGVQSIFTVHQFWDVARLLWFIAGGGMGAFWIINTLLWANKLNEEYTYDKEEGKKNNVDKTMKKRKQVKGRRPGMISIKS
ncbi:hypothetical protein PROFUN_00239 [Planoprotostelium fungivorum]|uniref:Uncharacterized protein n=1 Tax=Planoprotostelium fungivorum TaxID=1890364 RepID=A0A2P6NXT4_9EUKA|nr:hypothetical protein PROFUN_00239 [Planoprotostelium fungivorum]